jgi:hypothetical protein
MNKKNANERRCMRVNISCSHEEYMAIHSLSAQTTSQSINEYARNVLLGKPVVMAYRDLSLDALIEELNGLQNELELQMTQHPEHIEISLQNNILNTLNRIADRVSELCIRN